MLTAAHCVRLTLLCSARRELSELNAKLSDEQWVAGTRTYQQIVQELQRANELVAVKAREVEATARERDEAVRDTQVKNMYFHVRSPSY